MLNDDIERSFASFIDNKNIEVAKWLMSTFYLYLYSDTLAVFADRVVNKGTANEATDYPDTYEIVQRCMKDICNYADDILHYQGCIVLGSHSENYSELHMDNISIFCKWDKVKEIFEIHAEVPSRNGVIIISAEELLVDVLTMIFDKRNLTYKLLYLFNAIIKLGIELDVAKMKWSSKWMIDWTGWVFTKSSKQLISHYADNGNFTKLDGSELQMPNAMRMFDVLREFTRRDYTLYDWSSAECKFVIRETIQQ